MTRTAATLVQNMPIFDAPTEAAQPPLPSSADPIFAEPLSEQKFMAMWDMANLPPPANDDDFTPKLAIEIITLTREVLKVALSEVHRVKSNPHLITADTVQDLHAELAGRFLQRRERAYTARLFEDDGGMWTVFSHDQRAIAFCPDRDSAVRLVNLMSGVQPTPDEPDDQPVEAPLSTETQPVPTSPVPLEDPDPEDDPEEDNGDDQEDEDDDQEDDEDDDQGNPDPENEVATAKPE